MAATRGPQVVLEGYARTVARGGAGKTMRDNIAAMDALVIAGLTPDGNTVDGKTRTGQPAYDHVVAQFPDEELSAWAVPAPLLDVQNAVGFPLGAGGGSAPGGADVIPIRHLSNLIGKTSAVIAIIGDSTATAGPDQVGTPGGATTANGVDPSQMLWAALCDKLRADNPQITTWSFLNFAIGGSNESNPVMVGTDLVGLVLPPWFTNTSLTWLSYIQAAQPDVLFYLFGTNASAAGVPPPGGGGGAAASTFITANLTAIDAWSYTPNVVMVTNKTSTPADTTAGPDDLNSSNHLGQASFHRTFARSNAAGYTGFPKCVAKGFGLVDLGRYSAARIYGYDSAVQYMRAVPTSIVTRKPLITGQTNVVGATTVGMSTHGDFRLTFALRGMGGAALAALGIGGIRIGMGNFFANYVRLNIGAPQAAAVIWPGYLIDGSINLPPTRYGTPITTTDGADIVVTVSASGPRIRVWINTVLAMDLLGTRFVTPTAGGCPINVDASSTPVGSPTFDVTEFYEGVGMPAAIAMTYDTAFGVHVAGGDATVPGFTGGNSINHQTSMNEAFDRQFINGLNFCVPPSIALPGGAALPPVAANDAAAAALTPPVPIGGVYRVGNALQVRVA